MVGEGSSGSDRSVDSASEPSFRRQSFRIDSGRKAEQSLDLCVWFSVHDGGGEGEQGRIEREHRDSGAVLVFDEGEEQFGDSKKAGGKSERGDFIGGSKRGRDEADSDRGFEFGVDFLDGGYFSVASVIDASYGNGRHGSRHVEQSSGAKAFEKSEFGRHAARRGDVERERNREDGGAFEYWGEGAIEVVQRPVVSLEARREGGNGNGESRSIELGVSDRLHFQVLDGVESGALGASDVGRSFRRPENGSNFVKMSGAFLVEHHFRSFDGVSADGVGVQEAFRQTRNGSSDDRALGEGFDGGQGEFGGELRLSSRKAFGEALGIGDSAGSHDLHEKVQGGERSRGKGERSFGVEGVLSRTDRGEDGFAYLRSKASGASFESGDSLVESVSAQSSIPCAAFVANRRRFR